MAFSRKTKSVLITTMLYFGGNGATITVASKRTGRIIIEMRFS